MTPSSRMTFFSLLLLGQAYISRAAPRLPDRPFNVVWNVPSRTCAKKFGVEISLDEFDIVSNPGQEWNGTYVTIFYERDLGLYPKLDERTGQSTNGGLPQVADLEAHLAKSADDVYRLIPDADYRGLGVIDWEPWRPLWKRNWKFKDIYRTKSEEIIREKLPHAPKPEVTSKATEEFEGAARVLMEETLTLVKKLRPGGFWGFYLFPDCYNSPRRIKLRQDVSYDCLKVVKSDNDRLQWMWEGSTGLYPSVYLTSVFKTLPSSEQYVRARVAEAFRVVGGRQSSDILVFPYVHLRYRESIEYLTEADMVSTIHEAAGQGSAGVVIWGAWADVNTKENCLLLRDYVTTTFGPFAKEIVEQAAECSRRECNNHGRCVTDYKRKAMEQDRLAQGQRQLRSEVQMVQEQPRDAASSQQVDKQQQRQEQVLSADDISWFLQRLQNLPGRQGTSCRCYPGWTGERCGVVAREEL